ncbi:hypothetical protein ACS0TY_034008 [Phlomoides rotata]
MELLALRDMGDMVFKNLHIFNLSLLGKMAWRLTIDHTSLVCRVLKVKYFPRSQFLESSLGHNPSLTWRSIWLAQGLVRKGTRTPVVIEGFEDLVVRLWDLPLIKEVFHREDVDHILKTYVSPIGYSDGYVWHFERKGIYSAKLAYKLAENLLLHGAVLRNEGWRQLWSLHVPPKVKACMWRVCKGFVPSKAELFRHHLVEDMLCSFCDVDIEIT